MNYKSGLDYGIWPMVMAQVVFQEDPAANEQLRARKKTRTRLAIQDAAIELFASHGYDATTVEQIAKRAEIGTTTFFTYFRSKDEVILSDQSQWLPLLSEGIRTRPSTESDLAAVKHAVKDEWVSHIDRERTVRQARALEASHVLRGLSYDIGQRWLVVIADALAQRHHLEVPDEECLFTARLALTILQHAMESWMLEGCRTDVDIAIDHTFDLLGRLDTG